jgi:hypothetical protein
MYLEIVSYLMTIGVMVFNATFNNISAISWRSVLLVVENGSTRRKKINGDVYFTVYIM